MAECHRCIWNDRPPSPEKEAACHSCFLPPDYTNHKGQVFISIDSGASAQTLAETQASIQAAGTQQEQSIDFQRADVRTAFEAGMEVGGMRVLKYVGEILNRLTSRDGDREKLDVMNLLSVAAGGESLAGIAGRRNLTRAAVSEQWRGLLKLHPELAKVLDGSHAPAPANPAGIARAQADDHVQEEFDFGTE